MNKIIVMGFKGERMEVDVGRDSDEFERFTVLDLKRKIFSRFAEEEENIPEDRIYFIFVDQRLDVDDKLLIDYGIQHMSVVQMVQMVEEVDGGGGDPPKGSMGDRDHKNLIIV
ncbi:unnamed protein product [Knipowitschia caucasica]